MNQPPLYQIANYDRFFENHKSRLVDRCSFVCVPNKHGGCGLSNLLSEPNGAAVYGIWMLILQVCSRQPRPRCGYLTVDGTPNGRRYSSAELANLFRRPQSEVLNCLRVVSSPMVDFIKLIDGTPEAPSGQK